MEEQQYQQVRRITRDANTSLILYQESNLDTTLLAIKFS
jgi:hypothetical protein